MATKRIAQSAVNWGAMAEKVGENQRSMFNSFKSRSDLYLRKVVALPEKAPAIDWAFYQQKITTPGFVDSFRKHYETLQVPYPVDNVSSQIDAQQKDAESKIAAFVADSAARAALLEEEYKKLSSTLPFEQMTMEDYIEAFPEKGWNPNAPTFWPHGEDDAESGKADH